MEYINADSELLDIYEKDDRLKKQTLYVNPIDPMNKYIEFGRYRLDLKQLKGGKMQFRSKTNHYIKGLKGQRMTPSIKIVIDKLISNNEILYEDIDRLNETERELLADVAQKCEIDDRLKIPTPKLTKRQSEMNKFNIMRGQILAGNDSKEMIKDFKVMLLKFMSDGIVDKKEGNEIMICLLQMGL